jgi:hypothetical protein
MALKTANYYSIVVAVVVVVVVSITTHPYIE